METDFYLAQRATNSSRSGCSLRWCCCSAASSGCAILDRHNDWDAPIPYATGYNFGAADAPLNTAEPQYAAGQQAEEAGNPACIDFYFAAATLAWPYHASSARRRTIR